MLGIMASRITISIPDLETLRPSDLEGVRWIDRPDEHDWTEEHMLRLREIVNKRDLDHPLDVAALEQKLKNLPSTPSTRRSQSRSASQTPIYRSPTHTPSPRQVSEESRRRVEKWYNDLIQMGGRPAYPFELAFAHPRAYKEHADIINSLGSASSGFLRQKNAWIMFRKSQRWNRRTEEIFAQYQRNVIEYRQKENIKGDIHLLFDAAKQTKVDEWKEYQFCEHRKIGQMRIKAEQGRQRREQERKEWEAVNGKGRNIDPTEPSDIAWIYRTAAETELSEVTVFLDWIEQQLPKIAQEEFDNDKSGGVLGASNSAEMSETAMSRDTAVSTRLRRKNNSMSNNGIQSAPRSILKPVDARRVSKAGRKTKELVHDKRRLQDMQLSDTSSVILRRNGVRRVTEEQKTTTQRDAMFQSSANMASSAEPAPLRRSLRIKDLEAKKNNQSRIMQNVVPHTDRTSNSKGKPKRQESRYRNPPPQATATGIRKSRVTKRSNSSRVALQYGK
ncbi:hypothetical protein I7I53_11020 [Histoplasma capsulatum var. duboisii H88]|uniref:Uncharacterized protein n=1 Tax=Ajellomyces capsulatus (strain H88) TaxID=544711 RepID=A0A8A1L8C5_AJEC8|nr:hypothetical protein I7I53_11020 [Histoplasma capsulatum var. duboisii H88]